MVTAAAPRIPEPLKQQLKDGGRLILPVGDEWQELVVVTRRGDRFEEKRVLPVRFVPMTGQGPAVGPALVGRPVAGPAGEESRMEPLIGLFARGSSSSCSRCRSWRSSR